MTVLTSIRKVSAWQPFAFAIIGASLLTITGSGVFATLQATAANVNPAEVNAGTLVVNIADNGAGFSQAVENLVPGDVVNRFATLNNTGTLDAQALTFSAAATGTASLITNGVSPATTKALTVAISSCSVPWDASTGTCGGSSTVLLAPTVLGDVSTVRQIASNPIPTGGKVHLRVAVSLPEQSETTVNGVLPANTVQGGAVNITYSFGVNQRAATVTNS